MSTKIIALFNLKPGVSVAAYESWARRTDIPGVTGLASVDGFEVLRATALLGSEDRPPYGYLEIIDVNDMGLFGEDVATQAMQKVAAEFQAMVTDLVFILTDKVG